MCNLSQGVFDSGFKAATVQYIILLMEEKGMDLEECLDTFHVEEPERDEYRESVMAELGLTT